MTFNARDLEAIERMPRYYAWKRDLILPHLPPAARVLEIGCGTGFFLEQIEGAVAFAGGIEPDAWCFARAQARFAGRSNVAVHPLDATRPDAALPADWRPDAILFVNALEYISEDARALAFARAVLPPGGRLIVFTSALPVLTGALDAAMGQHRYRRRELRDKLVAAGFTVVSLRPVNLLGIVPWWWESRVLGRAAVSDGAYAARDRFVPLAKLIDRITGPPIGRNLLAVAAAS